MGNVIAIAAGYDFNVALKGDGSAWSWGHNDRGQLGDGSTTNRSLPVNISALHNGTVIACGLDHCAAITSDGMFWTWQ
jgi:alpha-tubulin suppressor-like RCC1 family protein